jgi:hypothetical protein
VATSARETRLRWSEPSWRADAERWIAARLEELGRPLAGAIEQPHVRPWGTALRVPVDGGTLWFKASIAPLAYEVPLLEVLGRRRPGYVPELVVGDARRGWMLVDDSGVPLVDLHPDGVPPPIWRRLLGTYAQLQLDMAPATAELVAAGVPDRRSGLVAGFERIVETSAGLISREERARLRSLVPAVRDAVDVVDALGLPDSVQHDDLHPWNVCAADGRLCFIDWGDACIAQPLLSLGVPLAHVDPADADAARDAYLEPWTALRPKHELLAACDAARLLGHVTGLLKWELINSGLTADELGSYGDVIPKRLRHVLEATCA